MRDPAVETRIRTIVRNNPDPMTARDIKSRLAAVKPQAIEAALLDMMERRSIRWDLVGLPDGSAIVLFSAPLNWGGPH